MAFNDSKSTTNKNKNLVVLSMVSKATGKTASWTNLTDTFARTVCKCEVRDVTKEMLRN